MRGDGSVPVRDVLVLGPVDPGSAGPRIDRLLERALFTRLALANGAPVPDDRLVSDLWGEAELNRPVQRLRVLVSRLRTALGDDGGLHREPGAYALAARPADLLAARAAAGRMHAALRDGDHREARAAAVAALELWRGPALADLRTVPFAAVEGERLDSWRLDLITGRFDAELALGAAAEIRDELERLAGDHPLHERICRQLAVALYRCGRQADALERLARLRRNLAEDLGVDPAPETAALELQLLRHDPVLGGHGAPSPPEVRPPDTGSRPAAALPLPTTSFVGREQDLADLSDQTSRPGVVTLSGGPGSGKSRLAIEVARRALAAGRAVYVVELAPLHRRDAVLAALASAAGVEYGETELVRECALVLDGALLVLDNAEHLIGEIAELTVSLLRQASSLTVLVTSQRPLMISEEALHRVSPLEPETAARLFEQRRAPGDMADGVVVGEICAAVDNLPLGVELAAGLTKTLTLPQLASRVGDRLRLLAGGSRDSGIRHTSLRAALDWSHELLSGRERKVLRRIAIFNGGFTLEAAEVVVPHTDLETGDVPPALAELVDRSLITIEDLNGCRRFMLLETVRDYALAELAASGETDAMRECHLDWCREFVKAAGEPGDFVAAEQVAAVFGECTNVLDALEHAPGTGRAAVGLRLALEMHTPWLIRGRYAEADRHFAALTAAEGAEPGERLLALSNHGFVVTMLGRFDEAARLLAEAAGLAESVGDDVLSMTVLYHRGIVEIERGRLAEAFASLLAGEELARKLSHERRLSAFADALGTAHLFSGESEAALGRYCTANAADRVAEDEHSLARGLNSEAQALIDLGRLREAVEIAAESDTYARRLDDRQILPLNDVVRGCAAMARGDLAEAERQLRSAVAGAAVAAAGLSMAHVDLALVLTLRGKLAEAEELLDAVYREAPEGSTPWLAARAASTLLAFSAGDLVQARQLAAATEADYEASGFGWRRYAERLEAVRARLA